MEREPMKKIESCSTYVRWITVLLLSALAAGCGGGGGTQIFGSGGATNTSTPPDTTRPRVTITVPATTAPGPTPNAPTNTAITAIFTESMAPATINGTSFTVTCALPCVSPAGVVSYAVGSKTAVFTPAA